MPQLARRSTPAPDLVVFSHLRWSWVWQRPQHLISRLAAGRTTWFIEEPLADPALTGDIDEPTMHWRNEDGVAIGTLHLPGAQRHVGFDSDEAALLGQIVADAAQQSEPVVWLYSPLALDVAAGLEPSLIVFDVMDDLSAFAGASPRIKESHRAALCRADIVFTGGRSLHHSVSSIRPDDTYLFPSGVESEHYAPAMLLRRRGPRPVAGYVGVIDERLDLDLLADMADQLPDWEIQMVGPVAKIDPATLPQRDNILYLGPATYQQLPDVMAGFDVALMPFALNEATRSISPTKTLEYLAAGLPVVSTRVPDVVADYGHVVHLADDGASFADGCTASLGMAHDPKHQALCQPLLQWQHWDRIAMRMANIVRSTQQVPATLERSA